jgi:hypothetical protein
MKAGHHEVAAPHKNRHLLERFEGYTDYLVVGMIVILGGAMLYGLLTASGVSAWMN